MTPHPSLGSHRAGIIAGQGQNYVPVKSSKELRKILRAYADVRVWVLEFAEL
jgi:hypothetical protein